MYFPSGTKVLYLQKSSNKLFILNLQTLQTTTYDIPNLVDPLYNDISIKTFEWCPYDESKILISGNGLVDVNGNGTSRKFRENLFLLHLLPSPTISIVSPKIWGKYGSESSLTLMSWMPTSKPTQDSVVIQYGEPEMYGYESEMINILNTDKAIPYKPNATRILDKIRFDKQGQLKFISTFYGLDNYLSFSGKEFLYDKLSLITWVSISPNGKKIALSILPEPDSVNGTFTRIWIFDLDSIQANPTVKPTYTELDLRKLFCKYAFGGVWAEYITDSTLAITMHNDQDVVSPMWEITDKGKLVRQLVEK